MGREQVRLVFVSPPQAPRWSVQFLLGVDDDDVAWYFGVAGPLAEAASGKPSGRCRLREVEARCCPITRQLGLADARGGAR